MLALIGNLDILELLLIAAVALMVFGKRLPEVTMRGMAQVMKLRREVARMWREAGLEEELRKVRRDLDRDLPRHLPSPDELMRQAERELEEERQGDAQPADEDTTDGDGPLDPLAREALSTEPASGESSADGPARPGWYPQTQPPEGTYAAPAPTAQARVEPSGEEQPQADEADDDEKESA
jgi:Sec-independent protein translocase protein TatA